MNIDEILKYQRPKETLYDVLGCDQSSSIEQINREYKIRALKLHPDKNIGDAECAEKFRQIQAAKDILSDESARRSYDSWLNSRINIPFEQWHNRKQHSMHWAAPKSSKLSIQPDKSKGQGSDVKIEKVHVTRTKDGDLINKFRNYEI